MVPAISDMITLVMKWHSAAYPDEQSTPPPTLGVILSSDDYLITQEVLGQPRWGGGTDIDDKLDQYAFMLEMTSPPPMEQDQWDAYAGLVFSFEGARTDDLATIKRYVVAIDAGGTMTALTQSKGSTKGVVEVHTGGEPGRPPFAGPTAVSLVRMVVASARFASPDAKNDDALALLLGQVSVV